MTNETYHPWLHRLAVLTAWLVLLPIVIGALVTTLKAGMAFLDWPTSDGHNMLLYPWLADIRAGRTNRAAEHGHRLAGMLIGIVSILLVVVTHWTDRRRWVRGLSIAVLLAVIAQGLLGGQRVLRNEQVLAMLHGAFAALVFSLMGCLALVTSRGWSEQRTQNREPLNFGRLKGLALLTPVVLFAQYLLGGMVRHMGTMLHEHLGFAVVAAILVIFNAVAAYRTGVPWLRRSAWVLGLVLGVQLLLGAGAWVSRFGWEPLGYVAVQQSATQLLLRTAHAVVGMTLLMVSVVHALRVLRLESLSETESSVVARRPLTSRPSLEGQAG